MTGKMQTIELPPPAFSDTAPFEALLAGRHSVREFATRGLALADVARLAWAAQGITHGDGLRTAPSAGALYPLELLVVTGAVEGLEPGVYRYEPAGHRLERTATGDRRRQLAAAAFGQAWIAGAPAVFVFAAVYERTTRKYAERGRRYVHMEVGHAAQNLFLQAGSLGLGTVVVGAFDDAGVAAVLSLPAGWEPLSLMPVGHDRSPGR